MPARPARAAALAAAVLAVQMLSTGPTLALGQPVPRLPKMVWELYLPEEYEACAALYPIYAALPAEQLAKLHGGQKAYLDGTALPDEVTAKVAAWFNSTRWGCDPPPERLDADAVAQSVLLWKCEDKVVEFCLQSPREQLWKKLTVACAPERAEWVRDGLPLVPHWFYPEGWEGGLRPPQPALSRDSIRIQQMCFKAQGQDPTSAIEGMKRYLELDWEMARDVYSVYAQLSASRLRELHQKHELRLRFRDLPAEQQDALAEAVDTRRLSSNIGFQMPLDYGRPPDARRRHFGITEVVFEYRRYHPDLNDPETGIRGVDPCPRPFRRVFITVDTPYPPAPDPAPAWWAKSVFRAAMPPELQGSLLAWQRRDEEWAAQWQYYENRQAYTRRGAPPRPRHPPD